MVVYRYIDEIQKKDGFYSTLSFYDRDKNFINNLLKKTYKIVSSHSEILMGEKPNYKEILFETSQPFYIHVKEKSSDVWSMDIYFKQEKYKELIFFINQLEKK